MRQPDSHRAAVAGEYDPRWVVNRHEMAMLLGVSASNLAKLVAKGMPRVAVGQYSIPHCMQFYLDLWRQPDDSDKGEQMDLRSRLTLAQARKYELDAEIMRSHYVALDTVERYTTEATAALASALDGLGARMAGVLADETEPAQVQALLTAAAREIREQYAIILESWAEDAVAEDDAPDADGSGGNHEAATGADG